HRLRDGVTADLQETPQHVLPEVGPEVADVGVVVHRRTAGVQTHLARVEGGELVLLTRQGVVEPNGHGSREKARRPGSLARPPPGCQRNGSEGTGHEKGSRPSLRATSSPCLRTRIGGRAGTGGRSGGPNRAGGPRCDPGT